MGAPQTCDTKNWTGHKQLSLTKLLNRNTQIESEQKRLREKKKSGPRIAKGNKMLTDEEKR